MWDDFVAASPDGSPYSTARYLDILCGATGGRFEVLGAFKGDELHGGIACYQEPEYGLPVITPRLLLYYSGLVLKGFATKYPSEATSRHLAVGTALAEALEAHPAAVVRLKSRPTVSDIRVFLSRGWSARTGYSYVVRLDDPAAILGRIEQNLRRLITRADGAGITVTEDDDAASFLRLHHEVHERKGARLYLPDARFAELIGRVRAAGIGRLYHARLPDGRSVATQLVLADRHPVAHTVAAGADGSQQNSGANPFLRYRAFCLLAEAGYQGCDLTDAPLTPVTRFKSQLGGDLTLAFEVERPASPAYRRRVAQAALRGRVGGVLRRLLRPGRS